MNKLVRLFAPGLFLALCTAAFPARGACYGLAVGINKYGYGLDELSYCCADAIDLREAFLSHGGGWTASSFTILTNSAATKTAIRKALTNLADKAVSGDTVVYCHSSHGGNDDTNLPSVYLCTYNADYTDSELAADLARFRSGVKLVVSADTCHSGGLFTDDPTTQSLAPRTCLAPKEAAARTAAWDLAGRVTERMKAARAAKGTRAAASAIDPDEIGWLTAAAYYQYSYEEPAVGHGLFTYYLLKSFDWGDANGDGALDFKEMFDFAACRVPYYDQTPQAANPDALAAAIAATSGVSPTPAGDEWDYADGRPNLFPTPLALSRAEETHGPHTLRNLLDNADFFSFPVSALRPVRFWSTGGTNLYADLYDSQFRLVRWEEATGQPGDFNLVAKPPEDGTMYLKVYSGSTNDAYTLHYCQAPGDDTFPTIFPPATNAIDSLVTYEAAAFRVVVPEGCTKLVASLSGPARDGDADLYVAKGFIGMSSDETDWYSGSSSNTERVTVSRPAPGEWFVSVYAWEITEDLTLVVTAEPDPLVATVPAELAELRLDGGTATAEVLYPDLVPPPATLPVYATTDLVSGKWVFKTNAPLSGGVVTLPVPAGTEYLRVGLTDSASAP
jgi:uncharacterized caspase-like protein